MISDIGISISDFFNLKSKVCAVVGVVTNNFLYPKLL